jgi:molybdopterin-biosynthesis enzyme MoeA-like protein
MEARYAKGEFNAARRRMATMPRGATLIKNAISAAPGFSIGNVHVMAGVPRIMQAMFDALAPTLAGGKPVISRAVYAMGLMEGTIAAGLEAIQNRYPELDVGSYPFARDAGPGVAIVSKGTDVTEAEAATADVTALMAGLGLAPIQGEPV